MPGSLHKDETMWTKEQLEEVVRSKFSDYLLVLVSNRQPYTHVMKDGKLLCQRQAGGLVTALDPVMRAIQGVWIAAGITAYDRQAVDEHDKVGVPPEAPRYTLRRVWLSKEEVDAYYYGYANEGLWPLAHAAYTRPVFAASDWNAYETVNRKFAEAILQEVGNRKAFVWIHDYHLALVARYLKETGAANIITSLFWHVPWPNPETFGICPQRKALLQGLLGNDLLGFHIHQHCDNFLAAVDRELESRIDRERMAVSYRQHQTVVRPFPISVDAEAIADLSTSPAVKARSAQLAQELSLGDKLLILGVDRIDYTKGIPDKLRAIDRLVQKYPETKGTFLFLQQGQVSRIHIPRYKALNDELNALVEEINWKHSQGAWVPVMNW